MSEEYDQFQNLNQRVMAREEAKFEKAKAKKEALEKEVKKILKQSMRNKETRQNIRRQAGQAVQRRESGQLSLAEQLMVDASSRGVEVIGGLDEIITGMDPLPWDNDDFDPWE